MRVYPDLPGPRATAILHDACVVTLLVCFALLGLEVHDAVNKLAVLGRGVHETGAAVQGGFDAAAEAVDGVPLVGGDIASGLRGAGEGTGGNVAELGIAGENAVHRLANLLGAITFLLPSGVLLVYALPPRIRESRRLTAAERVLRGADERTLAMRAAFSLPYARLLAYSDDPFGDLEAGRYAALAGATLEDAGLLPRAVPAESRRTRRASR